MSSKAREQLKSDSRRAQVRDLVKAGTPISRIAKQLAIPYRHAKQLAEQEGLAMLREQAKP